jgi:Co/Zn/Cd efflux system component
MLRALKFEAAIDIVFGLMALSIAIAFAWFGWRYRPRFPSDPLASTIVAVIFGAIASAALFAGIRILVQLR